MSGVRFFSVIRQIEELPWFCRVPVLVFNGPEMNMRSPVEWDKTIAIKRTSTFLTVRTVGPDLKRAGGGSIVVASSINGTRTFKTPAVTASMATIAGQAASGEIETISKVIQACGKNPRQLYPSYGQSRFLA